jgi:hypothetical protein
LKFRYNFRIKYLFILMKIYLFVLLVIILFIVSFGIKESFIYKVKNLSIVGDEQQINQIQQTTSTIQEDIDCISITNQGICDSHINQCKWIERGDTYSCDSICNTEQYTDSPDVCVSNRNCSFNGVLNVCEKRSTPTITTETNTSSDICRLLPTEERCLINSNCEFVVGECRTKDTSGIPTSSSSYTQRLNIPSSSSYTFTDPDKTRFGSGRESCIYMTTEEDCNKLIGDCEWNGVKCDIKSDSPGINCEQNGFNQCVSPDCYWNDSSTPPKCENTFIDSSGSMRPDCTTITDPQNCMSSGCYFDDYTYTCNNYGMRISEYSDPMTGVGSGYYDPMTGGGSGYYDPMTGVGSGYYDPMTGGRSEYSDPMTGVGSGYYDPMTGGGVLIANQ